MHETIFQKKRTHAKETRATFKENVEKARQSKQDWKVTELQTALFNETQEQWPSLHDYDNSFLEMVSGQLEDGCLNRVKHFHMYSSLHHFHIFTLCQS